MLENDISKCKFKHVERPGLYLLVIVLVFFCCIITPLRDYKNHDEITGKMDANRQAIMTRLDHIEYSLYELRQEIRIIRQQQKVSMSKFKLTDMIKQYQSIYRDLE